MEKINWNDKFKIGVEEVDLQHEYFILLVNRLVDEFTESNDSTYKHRLLEELALYTSFHFISKGNLMIKNNYPDFKEHMAIHRKLLSQLNDKINYYKPTCPQGHNKR
jgi:hemerythrin-like metal-binding protein